MTASNRREFNLKAVATARPMSETHPDLVEEMQHRRAARGRPPQGATAKQQISVRLDPDVIKRMKATGPDWQRRMNEVLGKAFPQL